MIEFLNHLGADALPCARQILWQTALLVAALWLLDLLVARRLRSTLRCGLWLLVVVKLLLPPSLQFPTGAGFWLGRWLAEPAAPRTLAGPSAVVETLEPTLSPEDAEPAIFVPPSAAVLDLRGGLLLAWVAGSLLFGLGLVIRNRPVRRLEREAEEAPQELQAQAQVQAAAGELGLRRIPRLRLSHANHSPAICGFFRPVILLPAELAARLSPAGLRAVLLHELLHLRRHDLWVNLLQVVVQVLWWWNPLAWLVNARIRTLREEAVDEAVMLASREDQVAYPATLVEVARHCTARPLLALSFLGIFESRRALHARVVRLLNRPLPVRANLGWSGWVSLLAAALLALPMGFTRRVEASDAVPPAGVAPTISPQAASQPALSPALAARYGLNSTNVSTPPATHHLDPALARRYGLAPESPAVSAPNTEALPYRMDPTLAARYGLLPQGLSTTPAPGGAATPVAPATEAPTATHKMDPVLARRYGLDAESPATSDTNTKALPYRMDPTLAARYGLLPQDLSATPAPGGAATPVTLATEAPPATHQLDPALARRYGLDPGFPATSDTNTKALPYGMDPTLAARYGLLPQDLSATPAPGGAATPVTLATEDPPASQHGANALKVTIPAEGDRFLLAGKALDTVELKELLTERAKAAPNLVLSLATEGEVPFARVNEALAAAAAAGITRFSLATVAAPAAEARSAGTAPATAVAATPSLATVTLLTRQFRVAPHTFLKGLEAVHGRPLLPGANGGPGTNNASEVQVALREFFRAAGVEFTGPADGTASPDQARKALFFNDRTGILFVRATAADLDIVETAIQALNAAPPQVQLEVKFVELVGNSATGAAWESLTANWGTTEPGAPNFTGILTEAQFRAALRDLEQRPGIDLLSAPRIITLSGRQARIRITEPKAVLDPATGTTNTLDVGPMLDAIPYVGADDHSIQLTVVASVSELPGGDASLPQTPRKQAISSGTLWDGQTLVLSSEFSEGPVKPAANGPAEPAEPSGLGSEKPRKRLLVFVTPTIIDPAGQRVHDPARLPFDPKSIPPQPK